MPACHVMLRSISDVKKFVSAACAQPYDIDILSGRYVVDAKSIMGLFSIDLSKPIRVEVHGTGADAESFRKSVEDFIVEA